MRNYAIPVYFLAEVFLGFCILQVVMLPLGVIAGRLKSQNLMAIYITIATLVVGGLGALGGVAISTSGFIEVPANYQVIRYLVMYDCMLSVCIYV